MKKTLASLQNYQPNPSCRNVLFSLSITIRIPDLWSHRSQLVQSVSISWVHAKMELSLLQVAMMFYERLHKYWWGPNLHQWAIQTCIRQAPVWSLLPTQYLHKQNEPRGWTCNPLFYMDAGGRIKPPAYWLRIIFSSSFIVVIFRLSS